MRRLARPAAVLLLAAISVSVRADSTLQVPTLANSGVRLQIYTPVQALPEFGFLPVRVSVQNGSAREGTWQVRFQSGNAAASGGAIASRFEISAGPGEQSESWHFVPLPDAAPSFTLEQVPASTRAVPIPPRPVTQAAVAETPTVAGLDVRVRSKFRLPPGVRVPPGGLQWTTRIEPGHRPGEKIGIAQASMSIGFNERPLTGDQLPLGFDVEDELTATMGSVRRFVYKETIPDPAVGAAPRSSAWANLSSSVTAESAARRALGDTGLLSLPGGVEQTVTVTALAYGRPGDPVAWLTTFHQTGSSRLLPFSTGQPLPPGTIVNLHRSGREGELIRTISFVEPAALLALDSGVSEDGQPSTDRMAAEARAMLLRYGFLQSRDQVSISTEPPGQADFAGSQLHEGSVLWFETGPEWMLPKPLLGSLPPDTSTYFLPGPVQGTVVRGFAVGSVTRNPAPSPAAGGSNAGIAAVDIAVTGPGIAGAALLSFDEIRPGEPSLALPVAASPRLAPLLARAFLTGRLKGTANVTPLAIEAMPADWRIWSPYHALLVREVEYDRLTTAQHESLRRWILQGGLLYIEPTVFDDTGRGPLQSRVPLEVERVGLGRITRLPFSMDDYVISEDVNLDGSAWIKPAQQSDLIALMLMHTPTTTIPSREFLRPQAPPGAEGSGNAAGGTWAAVIIAGFAIIAGPLNIFVLAPHGRRHRLFFTMPVLTILFTAALFGCIVLWDGIGGTGRRDVVVVSFPDNEQAVVFQDQVARTGTLGSRGFAFEDSVLMANLSVEDFDSTGRPSLLERIAGRAGGDWFRSHWAGAQHIRSLVAATGNLTLVEGRPAGSPMVQSTFAAELRDLVYVDPLYRTWIAAEVPPGRPVALERGNPGPRWPPVLPEGSRLLENLFTRAARLEPGRWIANGGSSGNFPVATLPSVTWQDAILVTGVIGPGDPVDLPALTPPPAIAAPP
jgi:hypothetical protein